MKLLELILYLALSFAAGYLMAISEQATKDYEALQVSIWASTIREGEEE